MGMIIFVLFQSIFWTTTAHPLSQLPSSQSSCQSSGKIKNSPLSILNSIIISLENCREGKSPDDELKAWQFWHGRQHSVKQRIIDLDQKNSSGLSKTLGFKYRFKTLLWYRHRCWSGRVSRSKCVKRVLESDGRTCKSEYCCPMSLDRLQHPERSERPSSSHSNRYL